MEYQARYHSIADCSLTFPPGWERAAPDAYLTVICGFIFDQSQLRRPFSHQGVCNNYRSKALQHISREYDRGLAQQALCCRVLK